VVFGLFGLGFFINFVGKNMDAMLHNGTQAWGQPALIWASLTLAVMTLPVVIVATEESLKACRRGCGRPVWRWGDQTEDHHQDCAAAGAAGHSDRRNSGRQPGGGRSGAHSVHRRGLLHVHAAART
jgi:hypothetical protein